MKPNYDVLELLLEGTVQALAQERDDHRATKDEVDRLKAEIERLRGEVGYMDAENQRIREVNAHLRDRLNEAAS